MYIYMVDQFSLAVIASIKETHCIPDECAVVDGKAASGNVGDCSPLCSTVVDEGGAPDERRPTIADARLSLRIFWKALLEDIDFIRPKPHCGVQGTL